MVSFFRNCIHYIWLIFLIMIIILAAGYFFIIREYRPSYESNTALLVGKSPENNEEIEAYEVLQTVQISEKLVFDVPEVIGGSVVLRSINENLSALEGVGQRYTRADFEKNVETEVSRNTRVVNVSVKHNDPRAAQLIAATIASTTQEVISDLMKQNYIHVIKEAELPLRSSGISKTQLWVITGIGGLLIGLLAVFLITVVENNRQ
ncbi:capsular polysaccharide biosynthesis protein [Acetoanaerobium pronyense]|uniref:Capsular polysaccharide biosynthesis protein n=1 Tax=Acetoanaerobium pronyense TaxID=1482736 RepID=A0ABS4KIZ9_9FIRM|nr:hypothetical protein [Acetoanaerobium pronyense]MBP2027201.1 capsular polysaccharide biosynthesis protein [Acetoanaerobium pronyense]